jgi:hypothetical protein
MNLYQILNFYSIIGILVLGVYGKKFVIARVVPYLRDLIKKRFG